MKAAATVTEAEKTTTSTEAPTVSGAAVDQRLLDEDYMSSEMDKGKITKLSLYDAEQIANNAIFCGKRNGFNPFAVTVLDESGNKIVHKVMDGCSRVGIPDFATAKAYSCIVTRLSSREFRDKYTGAGDPGRFC